MLILKLACSCLRSLSPCSVRGVSIQGALPHPHAHVYGIIYTQGPKQRPASCAYMAVACVWVFVRMLRIRKEGAARALGFVCRDVLSAASGNADKILALRVTPTSP